MVMDKISMDTSNIEHHTIKCFSSYLTIKCLTSKCFSNYLTSKCFSINLTIKCFSSNLIDSTIKCFSQHLTSKCKSFDTCSNYPFDPICKCFIKHQCNCSNRECMDKHIDVSQWHACTAHRDARAGTCFSSECSRSSHTGRLDCNHCYSSHSHASGLDHSGISQTRAGFVAHRDVRDIGTRLEWQSQQQRQPAEPKRKSKKVPSFANTILIINRRILHFLWSSRGNGV